MQLSDFTFFWSPFCPFVFKRMIIILRNVKQPSSSTNYWIYQSLLVQGIKWFRILIEKYLAIIMVFLLYKDSLLQLVLTTNKDRTNVLNIPFLQKGQSLWMIWFVCSNPVNRQLKISHWRLVYLNVIIWSSVHKSHTSVQVHWIIKCTHTPHTLYSL